MRRRDHFILAGMMACFTCALMFVIVYQEQARRRGIANTEAICAMFAKVTREPCDLTEPPPGVLDPKKRVD